MGQADRQLPFVSGIVLAAGAATRMGRPKQLLEIGGRSIVLHVLDAARASRLSEIVLVLGARAHEIRAALAKAGVTVDSQASDARPTGAPPEPAVRIVVNEDFNQGVSSSLRRGVHACDPRAEAAAILLGDQPGIEAALIDRVVEAFAKTRAPLVRPMFRAARQHVPGHPVVLARSVWPELDMLRGDEGARVLIAHAPERVHELLIPVEPPADIDTLEDYRLALEHGLAPLVNVRRPSD